MSKIEGYVNVCAPTFLVSLLVYVFVSRCCCVPVLVCAYLCVDNMPDRGQDMCKIMQEEDVLSV